MRSSFEYPYQFDGIKMSRNNNDPLVIFFNLLFYISGCSKELWDYNFLNISWILQISVWRNLVFQIIARFYWWSLYLRMLGKRSAIYSTHPVSFLYVVSKVSEKPVNNRVVDHSLTIELFIQLMLELLKASFFIFYNTHPSNDIIFDIVIYADDTTL